MFKQKRIIRRLKFVTLAILIGIFSVISTSCMDSKRKEGIIRIACFPNITHAQALLGMETGAFEKSLGSKYTVDWKTFNAGPAEVEAFFAGELDLGYIGPVPAINGFEKSKGDIQIIAGAVCGGAILVSREGLVTKNIKDLSGKKIAVPQFGNTQDLCLRSLLKENGLRDKAVGGTVEIVQLENPDIKTLMNKGDIDAAFVPEPWGSRLIKEAKANIILDSNEVPGYGSYPTTVIIGRTDFIKKNPEVVEKFLKAHVGLTKSINDNLQTSEDSVNSRIEKITKVPLSKDILNSSFKRLMISNSLQKKSIEELINLMKENGTITSKPNIDKLVNLEILNRVLVEQE